MTASFTEDVCLIAEATYLMASPDSELPNDIAGCHALIKQLRAKLGVASEQIEELKSLALQDTAARIAHLEALLAENEETITDQQQTIKNLAADNALLKRSLFGPRRERFTDDPAQALLFDAETLEAASRPLQDPAAENASSNPGDEQPKKKRTSKGRQTRVFPEFLPRDEERYFLKEEEIPEEMRNNPQARRFFKKVGEHLEMVPMQLKVVERYQEVIALDQPDESTVMVSAKRAAPLIQSFVGPSVWAYLTVCRFADHLPYYRIEDILGRSGFRIDRSTQWRWMRGLAQGVTPLVDLMWERALLSECLMMDETPVKELAAGKTITGYLWTGVGDGHHPYDCFFYSSDRRSVRPETFLSGYRGYLLSDAYVGYERIGQLWSDVLKASCWAHGRRKFEACHHLGATDQTRTALAYIRQLFAIEDMYRESSDEQRLAVRQAKSKPIVEAFHEWLVKQRLRQLPKAKLLGAINYMLNRWESFTRFLESGAIPLSSNGAERTLKYPILGRKAWLFVGNPEAGETAAKLFTLTKTCNRHRIDPFAYLQDVYARLPTTPADELPALLPDHWIKEHPQHLIQKRVQEALDRAQRKRESRASRRLSAA
jgi:transposase